MAFTPFSGTDGRIRLGGSVTRAGVTTGYPFNGQNNIAIAGVTSWRFPQQAAKVAYTNFESPVDNLGRVWEEFLRGVCSATVQIEGVFDGDTTVGSPTAFPVGLLIVADLLFYKNPPIGYYDLPILVETFEPGTAIKSSDPATFRMTGTLNGAPAPGSYNQLATISPATAALPAEMNAQFPPTITTPG